MDHSKVNILSLKSSKDQPILEEHPSKIATALRLFLQGLGFGELMRAVMCCFFDNTTLVSLPPFYPASSLGLLHSESTVGKELLRQTSLTETGKDLVASSEH